MTKKRMKKKKTKTKEMMMMMRRIHIAAVVVALVPVENDSVGRSTEGRVVEWTRLVVAFDNIHPLAFVAPVH